jgi:hypothetical protein
VYTERRFPSQGIVTQFRGFHRTSREFMPAVLPAAPFAVCASSRFVSSAPIARFLLDHPALQAAEVRIELAESGEVTIKGD